MSDRAPKVRIVGWLWWTGRILLAPVFRWIYRVRVVGIERVPDHGGTLFVANHISMWDPPMIGYALAPRRRVYSMAKRELLTIPVVGRMFANAGVFPVDRGGADRSAILTARRLLAEGEALLMFPEGTRHTDGQLGPAWPGAGALARVDGVQVMPILVSRARGRLGPVRIAIGAPLDFSDLPKASRSAQSQAVANRMMEAIGALRDRSPGDSDV
jgi:1-acyl-sn-glycerol-3-phosphate acyltransferase